VVLGVAGGIAAYKAVEVLRRFTESGHQVRVVPTPSALRFVGATTWAALSGQPVTTEVWDDADEVAHVRIGRDLLARVPALQHVADVVLHHHEHYDGAGYPDGLGADQISLASRIICVADSYCAMTSKRSYKESAPPEEARQELVRCKGTHFDPQVVDAFLAALDEPEEEEYTLLPELEEAGDFHHALRDRKA